MAKLIANKLAGLIIYFLQKFMEIVGDVIIKLIVNLNLSYQLLKEDYNPFKELVFIIIINSKHLHY